MQDSVAHGLAKAAIVGTLYLAGGLMTGTVGIAVTGVASEMLAGVVDRSSDEIVQRVLGRRDVRSADLEEAFSTAYLRAIDDLQRQWLQRHRSERRRSGIDGSDISLFETLRDDAIRAFESLKVSTDDQRTAFLHTISSQRSDSDHFRAYVEHVSRYEDEGPRNYVVNALAPQVVANFAEELRVDTPSSNRAWRAYQQCVNAALVNHVEDIRASQLAMGNSVADVNAMVQRVWDFAGRLESLALETRETIGEEALSGLIQDLEDKVMGVLADVSSTVVATIVQDGMSTREAVEKTGNVILSEIRGKPSTTADVLLRGPLLSLGLQDQLNLADRLDDQEEAARAYKEIEGRLEAAGFATNAKQIRERRSQALFSLGNNDEALALILEDAWDEFEQGQLWLSTSILQTHAEQIENAADYLKFRLAALRSLEAWYEHGEYAIASLHSAFKELHTRNDPWAARIGYWLCTFVQIDSHTVDISVGEVLDGLSQLTASKPDAVDTCIRIVEAEHTGQWNHLIREATTGRLELKNAARILCRHGRWQALHGDGETSIDSYRQAIEKFGPNGSLGDASYALRSIALVMQRHNIDIFGINEQFQHARLVQNEPKQLASAFDHRGAGVDAIRSGKAPDALRSLRRYLLDCRSVGDLSGEADAHCLLGEVYERANVYDRAIDHYIRGGAAKSAKLLAPRAPIVNVTEYLHCVDRGIVVAALSTIDVQARRWSEESVMNVTETLKRLVVDERRGVFGGNVSDHAWKTVASLSWQLSEGAVQWFVAKLTDLVHREPGHYRHTDEALGELLISFYRYQPSERVRVRELIVQCLDYHDLASELHDFCSWAIQEDTTLLEAVTSRAEQGNRVCLDMLAAAQIENHLVAREAERRLYGTLAYEIGVERNVMTVSVNDEMAAVYSYSLPKDKAKQLAQHLMAIAADAQSPEVHRTSAAEAVGVMADQLDAETKSELFAKIMDIADSGASEHQSDAVLRDSLHPFSRMRADLTSLNLQKAAIAAAAALAADINEANAVLNHPLWSTAGTSEAIAIPMVAKTILSLAATVRKQMLFPLVAMAQHPDPIIRKVATVLWTETPFRRPELGFQLAQDVDPSVRLRLAARLGILMEANRDLGRHLQDLLLQDPDADVRRCATTWNLTVDSE